MKMPMQHSRGCLSSIKRHPSSNNFCTSLALQPPGNLPTAEFVRRPVVTKQGDKDKEVVCGEKNKLDVVFAYKSDGIKTDKLSTVNAETLGSGHSNLIC